MKNLLLLCFLLLAGSAKLQAQPGPQLEITISVLNTDFLPINQEIKAPNDPCVFSDPGLTAIANTFSITSMEQAFPEAWGLALRSVYKVTTNSYSVIGALTNYNSQVFVGGAPAMQTGLSCATPTEWGPYNYLNDRQQLTYIKADSAWCTTLGDPNVILGVVDGYVDPTHPDLVGKALPSTKVTNTFKQAVTHGTAVTGLMVGKVSNDTIGLASVGRNCRAIPSSSGDPDFGSVNAIRDMLTMSRDPLYPITGGLGLKVINGSWFIKDNCQTSQNFNPYGLPLIVFADTSVGFAQLAFDEIYENGTSAVFGAGNDIAANGNCPADKYEFPASLNHNISVTSVGHEATGQYAALSKINKHVAVDQFSGASYTHAHNDKVDISAPGYEVWVDQRGGTNSNNIGTRMTGTSFASPIVAGALGLMVSADKAVAAHNNVPCLSPYQREYLLKKTASNQIYTEPANSPYATNNRLGSGLLDVNALVKAAQSFSCNDPDTKTLEIAGVELTTRCAPNLVAGLKPTMQVIYFNHNPNVTRRYKWYPISGNNAVLENDTLETVTIKSAAATNPLAWYVVTVTETKTVKNAGGRDIRVDKVASREIKLPMITDKTKWDLASRDSYLDMLNERNDQSRVDARRWNTWEPYTLINRQSNTLGWHESPEYRISNLDSNYIYTKVYNAGCATSPAMTGKNGLHLYWTLASTGERWKDAWTTQDVFINGANRPAGRQITKAGNVDKPLPIPSMAPGTSKQIVTGWRPIKPQDYYDPNSHFTPDSVHVAACLLARIVTDDSVHDYGMHKKESDWLGDNVRENNNIVTHNMVIQDLNLRNRPIAGTLVFADNPTQYAQTVSLQLINGRNLYPHLSGNLSEAVRGRVFLEDLYNIWVAGGSRGTVISHDPATRSVFYDPAVPLRLDNVVLQPGVYYPVMINLELSSNNIPYPIDEYVYFRQLNLEGMVGEGRDQIEIGPHDAEVMGNVSIKVHVEPTEPQIPQERRAAEGALEGLVQSGSENYLVYPNPANDQITIRRQIPGKSATALRIIDITGRLMSTGSLPESQEQLSIPLRGIAAGLYFVEMTDENGTQRVKIVVQ